LPARLAGPLSHYNLRACAAHSYLFSQFQVPSALRCRSRRFEPGWTNSQQRQLGTERNFWEM